MNKYYFNHFSFIYFFFFNFYLQCKSSFSNFTFMQLFFFFCWIRLVQAHTHTHTPCCWCSPSFFRNSGASESRFWLVDRSEGALWLAVGSTSRWGLWKETQIHLWLDGWRSDSLWAARPRSPLFKREENDRIPSYFLDTRILLCAAFCLSHAHFSEFKRTEASKNICSYQTVVPIKSKLTVAKENTLRSDDGETGCNHVPSTCWFYSKTFLTFFFFIWWFCAWMCREIYHLSFLFLSFLFLARG